jgi:hypothetical protein
MEYKDKAETLAEKMNRLSEQFELAEELTITGDDIVEYVEEQTQDIELYKDNIPATQIVNLQTMVEDFKYIRETLRETTENGRRVLNSVTLDLLDSEDDKRAALIMSFAELNKAVGDNMKLYMQSYKEISTTLLNIDKIKKSQNENPKTVNNTLNVTTVDPISTTDLIKKLRSEDEL